MVDFIAYLILTLNVSAFNRHTHCFNNMSLLYALRQLVMASSARHLLCIHFIYFSRKKRMLSNKMQRNVVAASNNKLTNTVKHLRKKSKFKAVFTGRYNSLGAGLVFCPLPQNHPKKSGFALSVVVAHGMSAAPSGALESCWGCVAGWLWWRNRLGSRSGWACQ